MSIRCKPHISILFICDLKATSSNRFHILKAEIGLKRAILVDTVESCHVQPQISSLTPLTEYFHVYNSGLSWNAVHGLNVIEFLLSMTSNSHKVRQIFVQEIPPSFL